MEIFERSDSKHQAVERLRRWRQAALVMNASRRFRYTLDLRSEEEKKQTQAKNRAHASAVRAAFLFKEASSRIPETVYRRGPGCRSKSPQVTTVGRRDVRKLKNRDGVEGIAGVDGSDKMKFCTIYLMNRKLIMYILVVVSFLVLNFIYITHT